MKATVHREALASALGLLTGATSSEAPILGSVLLNVDPTTRSVTAVTTDLRLRLATTIPAAKVTAGGAYALPVAKLLSMVRYVESETIQLAPHDEGTSLRISGGCCQFRLPAADAKEFPADFHRDPELTLSIKQADFIRLLEQVAFAQSKDSTRTVLMSTHLVVEVRGSIAHVTATATNGRIVARATTSGEVVSCSKSDQSVFRYVIPSGTVSEIIRVGAKGLEDHVSSISLGTSIRFALRTHGPQDTTRDVIVTSALLDVKYPDMANYLKTCPGQKFKLPVDTLRTVLDRVALVCTSGHPGVEFSFNKEELKLFAESPEYGSARDLTTYVDPTAAALCFKLMLSPQLLLGLLRPFAGDNVTFHVEGADKTVFLTLEGEQGFRGLILPMRPASRSTKEAAPAITAAAA